MDSSSDAIHASLPAGLSRMVSMFGFPGSSFNGVLHQSDPSSHRLNSTLGYIESVLPTDPSQTRRSESSLKLLARVIASENARLAYVPQPLNEPYHPMQLLKEYDESYHHFRRDDLMALDPSSPIAQYLSNARDSKPPAGVYFLTHLDAYACLPRNKITIIVQLSVRWIIALEKVLVRYQPAPETAGLKDTHFKNVAGMAFLQRRVLYKARKNGTSTLGILAELKRE
ncbi:hypothetical protein K458DRAFT_383674 [Lentithecium fluviatile CBS 122367]|uniref:Uncharacterized protein n=1 Tax=Lentithecium fluviatile CBS 122367 TaxID=1168545 RepID=A0A6G1JFT8_9PLEO|nr:hypothetical protein K458DRAFT_383674 [Lentithecium fluviatile CBS 122367]